MKVDESKGKPTSLLKLLPLNFMVLNGILAVSALIAAHLSWMLGVIIAILLGLVVITISFLHREASFSWTALIAVVAGLICGMSILNYYDVKDREIVKGISLADAVNYPEAGGYYFTGGKVRMDLVGSYVKRSKSTNRSSTVSYYYAAPVVGETWEPGQAVTVWAVHCVSEPKKLWEQPFRAGVRPDTIFREELATAVRHAVNSHGLRSHEKAVMIEWVSSPDAAVKAHLDEFKSNVLVFNIIWLVGLLLGRIYFFFRRGKEKKKGESTSGEVESKVREPISPSDLLRFLFVSYCFIALVFALFFSGVDFSLLVPIVLLVIGIVFYIIANVALLGAHKKEDRSLTDLLVVMVYPFLVYLLVFLSFDFGGKLFWMFPGFFYFLVITGGFVLGLLFSPFIAGGIREGFRVMGKMGVMKYIGFMLSGVFVVLVWFFTRFLSGFTELTSVQTAVFWFFLLLGIYVVIKFSYRHSTFNLAKDPELRRKYAKKK